MPLDIDCNRLFATGLVFSILTFTAAVISLLAFRILAGRSLSLKLMMLVGVNGVASGIAWHFLSARWELLAPLFLGLLLLGVACRLFKGFSFSGNLLMVSHVQANVFGLLWGLWIIESTHLSAMTRTLMLAGYPVILFILSVALIQSFEELEVICRRAWRRPRLPTASPPLKHFPKVSLHVPTYAEPPDLVISTLEALARLDYPNFEVIVVDNNTADPTLWRPVEAHCLALGQRFRFFHVDKLAGAKAGALNFALRHTAADAEIIGAIDSDYKVNKDFLAALVGHFDDPQLGFVQTPQAYRHWENHSYLRMCQWEYRLVFSTTMVSRNERMAAITVGTMGLIRRKALDEAGGWAEWCVTEDSELSVRIHALGYTSLYFNTVFGTGLIPDSFVDYKKQRFRWTYGPIQELRRHFRIFLPKPFARASALTGAQKMHHLVHGLGALKPGLEFLLLPLALMIGASMLLKKESIPVPPFMVLNLALAFVASIALRWHLFRTVMGCSFKDMLTAIMARMALDYIIRMSGIWGLFTRDTPWRRTNKFGALPLGLAALNAAMPELFLGSAMLATGAGILIEYQPSGLFLVFIAGWLLQGALYFTAPVFALIAEKGIRDRAEPVGWEQNLSLIIDLKL
jgi:cellulose synthase/poly-beta-1,6-N-acetylglucosamine synthase-like glycosyltransferase